MSVTAEDTSETVAIKIERIESESAEDASETVTIKTERLETEDCKKSSDDEDYHEDVDSESSDDDDKVLPHREAMEMFKDGVAELIVGDPLLSDLPTQITPEEVNSQIALEYGQAITVYVRRGDETVLPIVVVQNGSVLDLKHAIQRHVALKQIREESTTHISWRYVWRRYWLYYNGQKLADDQKPIREYGVRNKDEVSFIKRLQQR